MIEMDLLKIERTGQYEVTLGEFTAQFSVEPGKQDFSLLRLTHVGKSIAGFKTNEYRLLNTLLKRPRKQSPFQVQTTLGLDRVKVETLANSLVADLCVAGVFTIDIMLNKPNGVVRLLEGRNMGQNDAFDLSGTKTDMIETEEWETVDAFTAPFTYFDTHQLETLRVYKASG